MPDPRDFLPQPPWEGPPLSGFLGEHSWVDEQMGELAIFVNSHRGDLARDIPGANYSNVPTISEYKFVPAVDNTIRTLIAGYFAVAREQASPRIIRYTFLAAEKVWSNFVSWYEHRTGPQEEYFQRYLVEATTFRGDESEIEDFLEATGYNIGIQGKNMSEARAGGSEIIAINGIFEQEHYNNMLLLEIFIVEAQPVPKLFHNSLFMFLDVLARY